MSRENPFLRGYARGQQMKRQATADANDAEDRKFEIEKRNIELKALKLVEKQRARQESLQQVELLQGQPGQIPGASLSPTPGGPQADPGAQPFQPPQGQPSNVQGLLTQARSQALPLQSAEIPGAATPASQPSVNVPGVVGPDVMVKPQSMEELLLQKRREQYQAAELERAKNTYTVTDPSTGQQTTAPKEILDNLLTQTGSAKRQNEQQDFTASQNEARLKAESDRAQADRASREKIAEANRQAATVRALQSGKQSKAVQQALSLSSKFDSNAIVKNYAVIQEGLNFAKSVGPTSSDDIGLIYAFAKAMDPNSVVREGEYATVQKYAQSWAQAFGFKAERIFSNSPFLSAEARKNMVATIATKAAAAKTSYDNFHSETAKQIKNLGETPEDWIKDYDLGAKTAPAKPPALQGPGGKTLTLGADGLYH